MAETHFRLELHENSHRYFTKIKTLINDVIYLFRHKGSKDYFTRISTIHHVEGSCDQGVDQLKELIYYLGYVKEENDFHEEKSHI